MNRSRERHMRVKKSCKVDMAPPPVKLYQPNFLRTNFSATFLNWVKMCEIRLKTTKSMLTCWKNLLEALNFTARVVLKGFKGNGLKLLQGVWVPVPSGYTISRLKKVEIGLEPLKSPDTGYVYPMPLAGFLPKMGDMLLKFRTDLCVKMLHPDVKNR